MNRFIKSKFVWMTIIVMGMALFPMNAYCFWDEETLIITGITAGSILALGLIIVLVAGTIQDIKGDEEKGDEEDDFFSKNLTYLSQRDIYKAPINFLKVHRSWLPLTSIIPEKQDTTKRDIYWTQSVMSRYPRVHSCPNENPYLLLLINTSAINPMFQINTLMSLPLSLFPMSSIIEAVEKWPSAEFHTPFVTAAYFESIPAQAGIRLIPQDCTRLASDHFSTATKDGLFRHLSIGERDKQLILCWSLSPFPLNENR